MDMKLYKLQSYLKKRKRYYQPRRIVRRHGLINKKFSIISNNCFGGCLYDYYGMEYLSPTIGGWFSANDYMKFIKNIDFYLSQDVERVKWYDSNVREHLYYKKYIKGVDRDLDKLIIGRIYDVDYVFLHYSSFEDAVEKWKRRRERVDYSNLIVKFSPAQIDYQKSMFSEFCELQYKNKLFITDEADLIDDRVSIVNLPETYYKRDAREVVIYDTSMDDFPVPLNELLNNFILNIGGNS